MDRSVKAVCDSLLHQLCELRVHIRAYLRKRFLAHGLVRIRARTHVESVARLGGGDGGEVEVAFRAAREGRAAVARVDERVEPVEAAVVHEVRLHCPFHGFLVGERDLARRGLAHAAELTDGERGDDCDQRDHNQELDEGECFFHVHFPFI